MTFTISEFQLFKICAEKPVHLEANLNQLNLQFVRDPFEISKEEGAQKNASETLEVKQRKAIRLY
jgi:hypothetical protein